MASSSRLADRVLDYEVSHCVLLSIKCYGHLARLTCDSHDCLHINLHLFYTLIYT